MIVSYKHSVSLFSFSVHHSAAMKKYYNEHKDQLTLLDWPRCFGDIMPVEALWMEMLTELTENEIKVFTEQSLWQQILWRRTGMTKFPFGW